MAGLSLAQMRLSPNAAHAAQIVMETHPTAVFTSGRRDMREQAHAMAVNTIKYGVGWLGQTYKNQEMVKQLEEWMESNLEKTASIQQLTEGFYLTLTDLQAGQLSQFPHCRGDAWDIACPRFANDQIDEAEVSRIKRTIEGLPIALGLQLILTREGAHRIIHAQFNHALEGVSV